MPYDGYGRFTPDETDKNIAKHFARTGQNGQGYVGAGMQQEIKNQSTSMGNNAIIGGQIGAMTNLGLDFAKKRWAEIADQAKQAQTQQPRLMAQPAPGSTSAQMGQAMADEQKRLAHLKSQFEQRANPYTANYANNLFTKGALGSIQRNFTDQAQQTRDSLGARGFGMAGGQSGGVSKAFNALNYRKTQALGDAAAQADLRTQELGNQWETDKARMLDSFELARSQGATAAAEAALRGDRLSQLMPYEVAAAGLGNIGAQDAIDFNRLYRPEQLAQMRSGNEREALLTKRLAGEVQDEQWDRDNPGLALLRDLVPVGARIGGTIGAGMLAGPQGAMAFNSLYQTPPAAPSLSVYQGYGYNPYHGSYYG